MIKVSAQWNARSHDSITFTMERTAREPLSVLNVLLALSLYCFAAKVGTIPKKEIQRIWHDEEINSKTFRQHIPDKNV